MRHLVRIRPAWFHQRCVFTRVLVLILPAIRYGLHVVNGVERMKMITQYQSGSATLLFCIAENDRGLVEMEACYSELWRWSIVP